MTDAIFERITWLSVYLLAQHKGANSVESADRADIAVKCISYAPFENMLHSNSEERKKP